MRYLFIILVLGCITGNIQAQDYRFRLTQGLNFKFNSTTSISASLQNAYRENLTKIYSSYGIGLNYRVSPELYIRPALEYLYIGRLNDVKAFRIISLRLSYKAIDSDFFNVYGRFKVEHHTKNQYRYRVRLIPSLHIRTKRFAVDDRIKINFSSYIMPYIRIGGNRISQYDARDEYIGEFRPAGFHRFRFGAGSSLKYKRFICSISWLMQREFNLLSNSKYKINQRSIKTGKINHKYLDYNAISISLNYILNWKNVTDISDVQEEIQSN